MKTCGACGYFEPIMNNKDTGSCLVDPPRAFPTMMPPNALMTNQMPQQAIQGLDPPVKLQRRACRHFEEKRNG